MESQHIIVLGAQKCGTSTLHHTLTSHPQIAPAIHPFANHPVKEVGFFDDMWHRGFDWYASFFDSDETHTIDTSPNYLSDPDAMERIGRVFPHAKLIVTLRNPISRAISHHNHYQQMMPETRDWDWQLPGKSLGENIEAELKNPLGDWKGILKRGLYIEQLQHLVRFVDRNNLMILVMEDWVRDPADAVERLLRFLDLPPLIEALRSTHLRPEKEPIAENVVEQLANYYQDPNEKLFQWLGYQIEW